MNDGDILHETKWQSEIINKLKTENAELNKRWSICVEDNITLANNNHDLKKRVEELTSEERSCNTGWAKVIEKEHELLRLTSLCKTLAEALGSYHNAYTIMKEDGENYWQRFENNYSSAKLALEQYRKERGE